MPPNSDPQLDEGTDTPARSVSEIMNDKFPVAVDEKPAEKQEPIIDEPKVEVKEVAEKTNLPPGFDPLPDAEPKPDDNEPDVENDLKVLDDAIAKETDGNKKVNFTRFRTKLAKQQEDLTKSQAVINRLIEQKIIDRDLNPLAAAGNSAELEQKLNEAYDSIGKLSLVDDPRFAQKFDIPASKLLGEIASAINESPSSDAEKAEAISTAQVIASLPKSQRAAALTEHVPEALIMDVTLALREYDKLAANRNEAIENHKSMRAQLDREASVSSQKQIEQFRNAIKTSVTAEVEAEGYIARRPGDKVYNEFVDKLYGSVDEVFQSSDPKVQAKAMTLGVMAPFYRGMYEATQSKLDQVKSELAQYKRGTVRIAPNGKDADVPSTQIDSIAGIAKHLAARSKANYK